MELFTFLDRVIIGIKGRVCPPGTQMMEPEPEASPNCSLDTMPLDVLGSIVRVLDAKSLGRLLCVSRVFSTPVVTVRDSGVRVMVAGYVCFLRYEHAFVELARVWELDARGLGGPLRPPNRVFRDDLPEPEKSQVLREWVSYIEGAGVCCWGRL
eukprot:COSAG01_NODE_85_length_27670_cov_34.051467_8_plen_154_part_00